MSKQFLVWSNEHNAWWGPNRMGYTTERIFAGKYSEEEANQICVNAGLWKKRIPNEEKVACEPFDYGLEWAEEGPKLLAALKGALSSLEDDYLEEDPFLIGVKEAIRAAEAIGGE